MLRHIFALGVQPQALLLPKRPDRGKCNLCQPDRLQVLIDVLRERGGKDLSRHKEVMRHCHVHLAGSL